MENDLDYQERIIVSIHVIIFQKQSFFITRFVTHFYIQKVQSDQGVIRKKNFERSFLSVCAKLTYQLVYKRGVHISILFSTSLFFAIIRTKLRIGVQNLACVIFITCRMHQFQTFLILVIRNQFTGNQKYLYFFSFQK